MSGGSHNYAYRRVQDMADDLARSEVPERAAFAQHLALVAKAMHDIEWVDSCDMSPGDEVAAIRAVVSAADVLDAAINRAEEVQQTLADTLAAARNGRGSNDE